MEPVVPPVATQPPWGDPRQEEARPIVSSSGSNGRQRLFAAGGLVGFASLAVVFQFSDPHEGGFGLCPSLALTGLYCPGCGALRASYDLLHGQVGEAVGHNVLASILLPAIIAFLAWTVAAPWLRGSRRADPVKHSHGALIGRAQAIFARVNVPLILLAIIAVFTVMRNTPFGSALAP